MKSPLMHFEQAWSGRKIASINSFNNQHFKLQFNMSSPGNKAYCYSELTIVSLVVVVTIVRTHFMYPMRDGQAELA